MSIKIIAQNKKARFNYSIIETFEAGLSLKGTEVKSLRKHLCSLNEAYVSFKKNEAYLQESHIPIYELVSSLQNHEPKRLRKLLLHREELNRIYGTMREKGLSCVPLKIYFKKSKIKVEIALVKGKKKSDKRDVIKKREANRLIERRLKHSKK